MDRDKVISFIDKLKLKTPPVGVSFLTEVEGLPEDLKRPSSRKIKITICQGMSWARFYKWRVLITAKDLICFPAGILFNLFKSNKIERKKALAELMVEVGWVDKSIKDDITFPILEADISGILLEPLDRATKDPDIVVVYADPAQVARLLQGHGFYISQAVEAKLTGRAACGEYMILPYVTRKSVISIPGAGDRIFSGTQDNELVFSFPFAIFEQLFEGIKRAGSKIKTNYPFPSYMLYEAKFPPIYDELKKRWEFE